MEEKRKSRAWIWVAVLAMLPTVYVLGYGPYYWLYTTGFAPESILLCLEWIYTPIRWLRLYGPPFAEYPIRWYTELWLSAEPYAPYPVL